MNKRNGLISIFKKATDIFKYECILFNQCWKGEAIRQIGVSVSNFGDNQNQQISLFGDNMVKIERNSKLKYAIDDIRKRFGEKTIVRGCFINNRVEPLQGGVNDGNYLMMGGYQL